jgi:hypothetical protein
VHLSGALQPQVKWLARVPWSSVSLPASERARVQVPAPPGLEPLQA